MGTPDPQQRLVRLMEKREFIGHEQHTITLKHLRRHLRRLSKLFNVPRPKLRVSENHGLVAAYDYDTGTIELGKRAGKNLFTLAHEFAHHYVWVRCGDKAQEHGPTWVRAYARALHIVRVMPFESFLFVCRKWGVKFSRT